MSLRTPSTPPATAGTLQGERGFVLVWTAFLILPVLTMGMIFLLYGQASVTKIRAQLNAMNLVAIGSFGAEFDSRETLNAMAMLARWQGFTGAQPVVTGQAFPGVGTLILNHDVTERGEHKVAAFQRLERGRFSTLLNNISKVDTSGFARSRPGKIYAAVVLDYSPSLGGDGSVTDLLRAFEVLDSGAGPGRHGEVIDPSAPAVWPNVRPRPYAQNALPFGFTFHRMWLPWRGLNMVWPDFVAPVSPTCQAGSENSCGGWSAVGHEGAFRRGVSNLFMSYKRASSILVGVTGLLTPRLDVGVVGAPFPEAALAGLLAFSQASPPSTQPAYFDRIVNDGFYWVWRFDDPDIGSFSKVVGSPLLDASVLRRFSYDDPKSPFEHSLKISPDRLVFLNLEQMGYRKWIKYGRFFDATGVEQTFPNALNFLNPPLLAFEQAIQNYPPLDSFVWDQTYNPIDGTVLGLGTGYSTGIEPLFASSGKAHPTNADLPPELASPRVYTPDSGPPRSNSAPLGQDKWTPGYALCKLYDYADDGSMPPNGSVPCDDPTVPISSKVVNVYNTAPRSPGCDPGFEPRCVAAPLPASGPYVADQNNAVLCRYGFPRCYPTLDALVPVCFRDSYGPHDGEIQLDAGSDPVKPTCADTSTYPAGHLGSPVSRGTVQMPVTAPDISFHSLFHFLMDFSGTTGGSFIHSGVRNALTRCQAVKKLAAAKGDSIDCLVILTTDGRPVPTGWDGFSVGGLTEEQMNEQLAADVAELTGPTLNGRIVTWFMGKNAAYDEVLRRYETLDSDQQILLSFIPAREAIEGGVVPTPGTECYDFVSLIGTALGITCAEYNSSVLAEQGHFDMFKTIMGGRGDDPRRLWVESSIPSTATGEADLQESLGRQLAELLAQTKRQVEFDR